MNVNSFGRRTFEDVIKGLKMRSSQIGVCPRSNDKRREGRRKCEDRGRGWGHVSTRQALAAAACSWEAGLEHTVLQSLRRTHPTHTLILDHGPPAL